METFQSRTIHKAFLWASQMPLIFVQGFGVAVSISLCLEDETEQENSLQSHTKATHTYTHTSKNRHRVNQFGAKRKEVKQKKQRGTVVCSRHERGLWQHGLGEVCVFVP